MCFGGSEFVYVIVFCFGSLGLSCLVRCCFVVYFVGYCFMVGFVFIAFVCGFYM